MKRKFSKAIVCIVFSLILLLVAVLPSFADGVSGAYGSGYSGIHAPCPIYFNYYTTLRDSSNNVFWSYGTHVISPSFEPGTYSGIRSDEDSFCSLIGPGNLISTFSANSSISNVVFHDVVDSSSSGYITSDFRLTIINPSVVNNISISVRDFYTWSEDFHGYNSEFALVLNYDSQYMYMNDYAFVKFQYRPLGQSYNTSGYIDVKLPLSDFLHEGRLDLDLSSYFDELDYVQTFYHVRDFYVNIPTGYPVAQTPVIEGNLDYVVWDKLSDPTNLYPIVQSSMELADYTGWVTTALEGFFGLQIFPGFYLTGFLMVLIAFASFIWFLKLFAGG